MSMGERLDALFRPDTLAVVGASTDPAKWGHRLMRHTLDLGYSGNLWAVNPRHPVHIPGSRYAASIADVPEDIDLAIAAVPRSAALDVVRQCAEHDVRNLVLPASGFGEMGSEGAGLENEILTIARDAGMRVLGPNCFGLFSASGAFNATPFAPIPRGDIALVSQSGNVAGHAFTGARRRYLGFSHVVGLGNQIDLGCADVLSWLAQDPDTQRVALYIEGLRDKDAEAFTESLQQCRAAGKSVVVIKAGASAAGRAVAMSHTGSLATEDKVWDQILKAAGAIRVHSISDMLGVLALAALDKPAHRRVMMITDGGGDSIMAVDSVERHGLELTELPASVQTELDTVTPPAAPRIPGRNPVTLDPAGGVEDDPEIIPRCLLVLEGVEGVDTVVVGGLFGTYEHVRQAEIRAAAGILAIARRGLRTIVQSPAPIEHSGPLQMLQDAGIPVFDDMEHLLAALSAWLPPPDPLRPPHRPVPRTQADPQAEVQWAPEQAYQLLSAAGAALAPQRVVALGPDLLAAGDSIGYPLCLKTANPAIVHKSDVGGVRTGIKGAGELRTAAEQMVQSTGSDRLLVMPSLAPGFELMLGARCSAQFGPVLVLGRGGIWAEVEADTATFVGDVTEAEFRESLARLRCAPMLFGGRGQSALDVASLFPLARALTRLVREHPEMTVDLNPVFLYENGYGIADLRVVTSDASPPDGGARAHRPR
jgi:acetyltransferase